MIAALVAAVVVGPWPPTVPTLILGDSATSFIEIGDPPRGVVIVEPGRRGEVLELLWRLGVIEPPFRPYYREFREEP